MATGVDKVRKTQCGGKCPKVMKNLIPKLLVEFPRGLFTGKIPCSALIKIIINKY